MKFKFLKIGVIYKITNKTNNKCYIGKTKDFDQRIKNHIYVSNRGRGNALHSAIRKYGKNDFKIEIIFVSFYFLLNMIEIYFIKKYNSLAPNGYNLTKGGDGGNTWDKLSKKQKKDIKEKRSKFAIGNKYNKVYLFSVRNKISKSLKKYNKNLSTKGKEKHLQKVKKGIRDHYNSIKGHERKEKSSKSMSGKNNPMSLFSLSKRHGCSIEDARKFTPNYGKKRSQHVKNITSKTHKGKIFSEDSVNKMLQSSLKYKYVIIDKINNKKIITYNLYRWCKQNSLAYGKMCGLLNKENKRKKAYEEFYDLFKYNIDEKDRKNIINGGV